METERVIEIYADIIREATVEHMAPNWTLDLIEGGLDPEHMRMMARRWIEGEFQPADLAEDLANLSLAVEENAAEIIRTR